MKRVLLSESICLVGVVIGRVMVACGGSTASSDAGADSGGGDGGAAFCVIDGSATCVGGSVTNPVLTTECTALKGAIEPGMCPSGHVGCCAIGAGTPFMITECAYPPIDLDAAASICAQVDGSFTAN